MKKDKKVIDDKSLIERYEAGSVNMGKLLKKTVKKKVVNKQKPPTEK